MNLAFRKIFIVILLLVLTSCTAPEEGCILADVLSNGVGVDGQGCITNSVTNISNSFTVNANGNYSVNQATCDSTNNPYCVVTKPGTNTGIQDVLQPNNGSNDKYGKWLNTGIQVNSGDSVNIKTTGTVGVCPSFGYSLADNINGLPVQVNSINPNWTTTGVTVNRGDYINITFADPTPSNPPTKGDWPMASDPNNCASSKPNASCNRLTYQTASTVSWNPVINNNTQLYDYVGSCYQKNGSQSLADDNVIDTSCWDIYGSGVRGTTNSASGGIISSNYGNSFGMCKAGDLTTIKYSQHYATQAGELQFGIYDTLGNYSDNAGGYNFYYKVLGCPGYDGFAVQNGRQDVPNLGALQAIVSPASDTDSTVPASVSNLLPNINDSSTSSQDQSGSNSACLISNTNISLNQNSSKKGENTATTSGYVWLRVVDGTGCPKTCNNYYGFSDCSNSCYGDNYGSYKVDIDAGINSSSFSQNLGSSASGSGLLGNIRSKLLASGESLFKSVGCSDKSNASCVSYIQIIRAMITLYIIIYAISFLMGTIEISQMDLVIRLIKIGILLALTSPSSWDYFNNNFYNLFIEGQNSLISMVSNQSCSHPINPFSFTDDILQYLLFNSNTWLRILSMLLIGLLGVIYMVLMLIGVVLTIIGIVKAILVYILATVATSLLISLGPIFLPMMMFQITKPIFDNYIKYLIRYSLEPVILISGLVILTELLKSSLNDILGYGICWKCALPISLTFGPGIGLNLFCIPFYLPWGFVNSLSTGAYSPGLAANAVALLGKFINIMFFIMIANFMRSFADFAKEITSSLAGAPNAISIIESAKGMMHQAEQTIKERFGMDDQSIERRRGTYSNLNRKKQVEVRDNIQPPHNGGKK